MGAVVDVATLALGVLSFLVIAEGLTGATRARRRAKESAEVAAALPEGRARDTALEIAAQEVAAWRRQVPTPEDKARNTETGLYVAMFLVVILGVVAISDTWIGPQPWHIIVLGSLIPAAFAYMRSERIRRAARADLRRAQDEDNGEGTE